MKGFPRFDEQYKHLLKCLLEDEWSAEELNERTGHRIRAMRFGLSLMHDLSDGYLPLTDLRKTHPRTAAAEIAWFVSGSRHIKDLRAPKIWEKFADEEGFVEGAYGYRWRRHFERDQLLDGIDSLRKNRSDRRIFVSAWDPAEDGLGRPARNVPCPVGFTLSVVDGKLNSTLLIRSSDVFVGLPYDAMGHAMLMDVVAETLVDVTPGVMTISLAHPHIYDSHYEQARTALEGETVRPRVRLANYSLSDVEEYPDGFIKEYQDLGREADWPSFNPLPELVL